MDSLLAVMGGKFLPGILLYFPVCPKRAWTLEGLDRLHETLSGMIHGHCLVQDPFSIVDLSGARPLFQLWIV